MNQRGQAVLETILFGLLLLAPLIWALTVLADVHRAALASTAAAREAGFDAARATDVSSAARAIDAAVAGAFEDHGLDAARARVQSSTPAGLARGGSVEVRVAYPVAVLRAPFLGVVSGPELLVTATHVSRVDPYRSRK